MTDFLMLGGTTVVRRGFTRMYLPEGMSAGDLDGLLAETGEPLKSSHKAHVRRVGPYLIKESQHARGLALIKHTFQRMRYRRGWLAAHFLGERGVGVPRPIAFVEWRFAGLISGNAMVSEYLEHFRNVESFLHALVQRGAGQDTLATFLAALGDAVNLLEGTGAYHSDLSGKNIFTRDGNTFVFIDLDAVVLDHPYAEAFRLKNHIQLYDSFCDLLNDAMLVPFIEKMLPREFDPRVWMPQVRNGQKDRRLRSDALRDRKPAPTTDPRQR